MTVTFVPSPEPARARPTWARPRAKFYLPEGMDVAAPIGVHVVYDFPQRTEYDLVSTPALSGRTGGLDEVAGVRCSADSESARPDSIQAELGHASFVIELLGHWMR